MYECIAKCPELDYDGTPHCRCSDLDEIDNRYPDGCPCGNRLEWKCVENGGEQNG